MDTITFRLPIELKDQFQIKLIKETLEIKRQDLQLKILDMDLKK